MSNHSPDLYDEVLPGTHRMFDEYGNPLAGDAGLKKHGNIVLVPQPTDSPNDPLHWSLLRKIWQSTLVCFVTALTAATSNDAGGAQYNQNLELGIPYSIYNTGAGILFIGIGYWTLLISPIASLYGRRLPYLIGMLIGLIGAIWFAEVRQTRDAIWNQLFVGASESVAEANVQLSLMDLWFQHQRGSVLGVYVLATSIGTYLGPLIASYIADSTIGWRWIGWLAAIISGGTFVVLFFTLEETSFERDRYVTEGGERYLIDGVNRSNSKNSNITPEAEEANKELNEKRINDPNNTNINDNLERRVSGSAAEKRKTYWQRIALITPARNLKGYGFKQYFARLWHILRVFTFPAVWYSGLQWGAQDAWLTFYLTVIEDNWYGPPWNYSDAADGNMNIPCLIGAVIGCFYGGWFSDKFMLWMVKRNGGVMEAEFRLWLMFPTACIFPVGIWVFGYGTENGWPWPAPYVALSFIGFGWGCAGDLSMAYLMDAYPEMVLEGMVGVAVINNTIGMIFSFGASQWLAVSGVQNTFIAIGVLAFVFMMTTGPMIFFGTLSATEQEVGDTADMLPRLVVGPFLSLGASEMSHSFDYIPTVYLRTSCHTEKVCGARERARRSVLKKGSWSGRQDPLSAHVVEKYEGGNVDLEKDQVGERAEHLTSEEGVTSEEAASQIDDDMNEQLLTREAK